MKKKVLLVSKDKSIKKEKKIIGLLQKNGFFVKSLWKNNLKSSDIKNFELVISAGGDGTALSASHYLTNQKLIAVNSSPRRSEGALTTVSLGDFLKKIHQINQCNYKTEKLERIEVLVNNRTKKPLALNEVFIGNRYSYLMFKHKVRFRHRAELVEEEQLSSGVIFSTGTGSTAWFKSSGGEPFSPQAKYIKMIVREPYIRKLRKFFMIKKTIHQKDSFTIIPLTPAILAIDSIREFKLNANDNVAIRISKFPLLRIK